MAETIENLNTSWIFDNIKELLSFLMYDNGIVGMLKRVLIF